LHTNLKCQRSINQLRAVPWLRKRPVAVAVDPAKDTGNAGMAEILQDRRSIAARPTGTGTL
jgi:hypothetical protein